VGTRFEAIQAFVAARAGSWDDRFPEDGPTFSWAVDEVDDGPDRAFAAATAR
jgi:hypothetical protein